MTPAIRQQAGQYYEFYKRQANPQALLARVAADLNLAPTELNFATLHAFGSAMYGIGQDSK